jgi:Putative beta barrel porin-7 (BBP7)
MRMGSFAKSQTRLAAQFVLGAAVFVSSLDSFGQVRNASYMSDADSYGQRPMQAYYNDDAYGNQTVAPTGYFEPYGDHGSCDSYGYQGMNGDYIGGNPMGYAGTDPSFGCEMDDSGFENVSLVDQRGPHYFDIRAEAVFLARDKSFGRTVDFSAQNVGGPVVLSSRQLDIEGAEAGFRVMGRYDILPLSVVEFGYMGMFDNSSSAFFTDPTNNLFSLFSRPAPDFGLFGTSPGGVNLPGGPNPFTERANTHSITLESDLQTAEISYRRYWLGYHPRISGTLLAGFRYTKLDEDFEFVSQGSEPLPQTTQPLAGLEYLEDCENNLAGFQTGGDMWICLMQGVRFGTEVKFGLYNNHSRLANRIVTTPPGVEPPSLFEEFKGDHAAFIGDASIDLVLDLFPSLSFRAGYEILYMNNLVLAGDNFNEVSPYGNQGVREGFVNDDGELTFNGGHVGIEYIW